jgi:hypothetical protein
MKTLIALLLMVAGAQAQNWAVCKTGVNTNGIPVDWPIIVGPIGTNTTTKVPGAVVMTMRQIDDVIAANKAEFIKATWVAPVDKDAQISTLTNQVALLRKQVIELGGIPVAQKESTKAPEAKE